MTVQNGKHRGTLVCVVLKAKNLPNKRSIGKQDPYCVLQLGDDLQKTQPDKRGGQHPTWDEQLHFEIYDDMEDAASTAKAESWSKAGAGGSSENPSSKPRKTPKVLKLSCYADDARDPEIIGEGMVDLTDTLKTGEFDEWVTIKSKERYAGEVYLELTFYSAAAPPKKKKPIAPSLSGTDTYGGAGTFSDDTDDFPRRGHKGHPSIPAHMRAQDSSQASESSEFGQLAGGSGRMPTPQTMTGTGMHRPPSSQSFSDVPPTLRPSSSLANLDTYNPPYAPPILGRSPSPQPPNAHQTRHEQYGSNAGMSTSTSMSGSWGNAAGQQHRVSGSWGSAAGQHHQQQQQTHHHHRASFSNASSYDPTADLSQTMSTMTIRPEKPLPPPREPSPGPTSSAPAPPPNVPPSYIYHNPQHPGAYQAFQGAMPMMNLSSAPSQPIKEPPLPGSASFHALPPVPGPPADSSPAPIPSVINAQALYQSIAGPPTPSSQAPSSASGHGPQSPTRRVSHTPSPAPPPRPPSATPSMRPLPSVGQQQQPLPQPYAPAPPQSQPVQYAPPPLATPSIYAGHHVYTAPSPASSTPGLPVGAPLPPTVYQPYGAYYAAPPPAPGAPVPPPPGAYQHPAYYAPQQAPGYPHYAAPAPPQSHVYHQQPPPAPQAPGAVPYPPPAMPGVPPPPGVPVYGHYAPAPAQTQAAYPMYSAYPPPS